jgi:hypothetical protein
LLAEINEFLTESKTRVKQFDSNGLFRKNLGVPLGNPEESGSDPTCPLDEQDADALQESTIRMKSDDNGEEIDDFVRLEEQCRETTEA